MLEAKAIRKHSAQHDLFHRLHSIAADEAFVRQVAEKWYETRFEVVGKCCDLCNRTWMTSIANQRCGTWYCDPSVCALPILMDKRLTVKPHRRAREHMRTSSRRTDTQMLGFRRPYMRSPADRSELGLQSPALKPSSRELRPEQRRVRLTA